MAIRYPRGRGVQTNWKQSFSKIEIGKGTCISKGEKMAVLSIGTIGNTIVELQKELPKNSVAHSNMRFVKPLDAQLLHSIFKKFKTILTIEDGTIVGGFGSAIIEFANKHNYKNAIKILGIPDTFIEHGKTEQLFNSIQLSKEHIKQEIVQILS